LPIGDWRSRVRRYEELGFSSITFTDHVVVPQWEPFAALAAIAAVTERIRVGTLVADNGLRNPVMTAKAAATIDRLSGGRLELGLGAGYVAANFAAAGARFAPARERLAQLEESIELIRHVWTDESTTFSGRYYQMTDSPRVAPEPVSPRLLVGGGGQHTMRLAGRVADVASMIPRQNTGEWSLTASLADSSVDCMAQKAAWVREGAVAAGRDPASVELNTMVFKLAIGDDASVGRDVFARDNGLRVDELGDSTLFLAGAGPELRERLQEYRDRVGLTYFSFFDPGDDQIEYLADHVVGPLSSDSG
jgi:probable F420-dependent oxidoreductase